MVLLLSSLRNSGSFLGSLVSKTPAAAGRGGNSCVQLFNMSRSCTMSSDSGGKFLIEEEKYGFLKELGLDKVNKGVYNGKWFGSGEVSLKKWACSSGYL